MSNLVTALMEMLRADAGVQAVFGSPARVFDGETERPAYPYAELVSVETRDVASAHAPGGEHRLTFAVNVREARREDASAGLEAIIAAIRGKALTLAGANIILAHPLYFDILRGRAPLTYRGLLRLRILTDKEPSDDG